MLLAVEILMPLFQVQGATTKMYWAVHLSGPSMRIYTWDDSTMSYQTIDREIPALYLPSGPGFHVMSKPRWR